MGDKPKGSKKNRKHGRNKLKCDAYRRSNREALNAEKRQARHRKQIAKFAARKGS